ncbi:MAG: flagellar filament capping protein FliD [Syntrophomonadaceae bacterium]|jgi:flagellar hook-associated protein 2
MSVMRIGGLASGMDIDTIVESLMQARRAPLDKLLQERQKLQWQQEDYRSINNTLFSFRNEVFNYKLQGLYNAKKAASSDEGVASISAATSAIEGTYSITVNRLASGVNKGSTVSLAEETNGEGQSLTLYQQFSQLALRGYSETDEISVTINGTELNINLGETTIGGLVAAINSQNLGVIASYDTEYNRFFLNSTTTGEDAQILITSDEANLFSNGTHSSILQLNINEGQAYNGQNASISLGDAEWIESPTNNISISGLNMTLKDTGEISVVVSRDVDQVVESITALINRYNEVIDELTSKIHEKRYLDYPPLTEAQKKEMSEKEIELWEEKARSGLLRSDLYLSNIISQIRTSMSRFVEGAGKYNSLSAIGIKTRLGEYNGKLYIDEAALRKALNEDPESVTRLFTNNGETENQKGIAEHLYEAVNSGVTYLSSKAGRETTLSTVDESYIGKRLSHIQEEVEKWEDRLIEIENRYWRQFTYMEAMISRMNAQSAWLAQQFNTNR